MGAAAAAGVWHMCVLLRLLRSTKPIVAIVLSSLSPAHQHAFLGLLLLLLLLLLWRSFLQVLLQRRWWVTVQLIASRLFGVVVDVVILLHCCRAFRDVKQLLLVCCSCNLLTPIAAAVVGYQTDAQV
jgi:hypothetical protein